MNVKANLSDERVRRRNLSERETRKGKLANADEADTKLRDCNDPASKLPDGYDAFRDNRDAVRAVLEGDMDGAIQIASSAICTRSPTRPIYPSPGTARHTGGRRRHLRRSDADMFGTASCSSPRSSTVVRGQPKAQWDRAAQGTRFTPPCRSPGVRRASSPAASTPQRRAALQAALP